MDVLKQREQQGRKDPKGPEANPLPANKSSLELGSEIRTRLTGSTAVAGYAVFVPVIDEFLRAHLFGDIFGRDNLDFQSREIATISALATLEGLEPQLKWALQYRSECRTERCSVTKHRFCDRR